MTENKRFTYNASKNKYIGTFFCNEIPLTNEEVVDELQGLSNENIELKRKKERYKRLSEIREEEINNRILTIKEFINNSDGELKEALRNLFYSEVIEYDLSKQYRDLKKENEWLKQQIKDLYKFVKCDVDNEIDVYPKSILEYLVNILKIIGDVEITGKLDFVYDGDSALIFENKKDIGVATGKRLLQIIELVNTACGKYNIDFECLEECLDDFDNFLDDEYNGGLGGYTKDEKELIE